MTDTSTKDAYTEAIQANDLRKALTEFAKGQVKYNSVDRDWINDRLVQLGADPVTSRAEYRISTPITGDFGRRVTAHSRNEALELFQKELDRVLAAGKININSDRYDNVYHVEVVGEPVFYAGPADAPEPNDSIPGLAGLKTGIRAMLKEGVAEQNVNYHQAKTFLDEQDLEALPTLVTHVATVPVSGMAKVTVTAFEGDDPEALQAAVVAKMAKAPDWMVTAEEVGTPVINEKAKADEEGDEGDDSDPGDW